LKWDTLQVSDSGVKSHLIYPMLVNLRLRLDKLVSSCDPYFQQGAIDMVEKFKKYYGADLEAKVEHFIIAQVMDPRFKLTYVKAVFKKKHGTTLGQMKWEALAERIATIYTTHYSKAKIPPLEGSMVESGTIESQEQRLVLRLPPSTQQVEEHSDLSVEGFLSEQKRRAQSEADGRESELDRYLDEPLFFFGGNTKDYEVTDWWKINGPRFPHLSLMAMDYFAMRSSAVPSESAFSKGGRVVSDTRSSLSSAHVRDLMLGKSFLEAIEKNGWKINKK